MTRSESSKPSGAESTGKSSSAGTGGRRRPAGDRPATAGQDAQADAAALRRCVRRRAAGWLRDPNITSVGVGFKEVDGQRTDRVCLQFTVAEKLPAAELEILGTSLVPETVDVEGVATPTDVVQRSFAPSWIVRDVTCAPSPGDGTEEADDESARRTRVDPVRPGVSVGHPSTSAGTLGCIVYDCETGQPRALSNWHVLHGPLGELGDDTLQPGQHDDNRLDRNRMGELVRSHLGAAGDGALASIEERGVDPEVLGTGVVPETVADPELGDLLLKSGRTTGVTLGEVTRVDVMVELDYGQGVGLQTIGGFELGPVDADGGADGDDGGAPADPSEPLSEGGDSGAVWLGADGGGRAQPVLVGVHFGGDAGGGQERALACLGSSILTKLGATLTPRSETTQPPRDGEAGGRPGQGDGPGSGPGTGTGGGTGGSTDADEREEGDGYTLRFLGETVPVPTPGPEIADDLAEIEGGTEIHYTHFSLAMSRSRGFARWVAWNIDGADLKRISRDGSSFRRDPRLPAEQQHGDELYRSNDLDRGHLARRADLLWGPMDRARQANDDSFFFTNIAPQMNDFNQGSRGGLWGRLEDSLFEQVEVDGLRISVMGGCVLREQDPVYRGVPIPREFWKLLAYRAEGEDRLRVRAFLLTQDIDRLEALELDEFATYQVDLPELTERTGLVFAASLHDAGETGEASTEALHEIHRVERAADVVW